MGLRRKKVTTRLRKVNQTKKSDGIQAPGACGPGLQRPWGPGPQGLGPNLQPTIFRKSPGRSLAKAWVSAETAASGVGTWRETKPGYPSYPS